jgi:hypothetical protein
MPTSDWYTRNSHWIVVVFLLALLISVSYPTLVNIGYDEGYRDAQATRSRAESKRDSYKSCLGIGTSEEVLSCLDAKIEPARAEHRAEEELEAQKAAARWALASFITAALLGTLTVFITGLGLIYIRETLAASSGMHETAVKQLTASQRPWISITNVEVAEDVKTGRQGPYFRLKVHLQCAGGTPAMRVRVSTTAWDPFTGREEWKKLKDSSIRSVENWIAWSRTVTPDATHIHNAIVQFYFKDNKNNTPPCVIICIGYEFAFEEGTHITLETFEIHRLGQFNSVFEKELIPASEFSVVPHEFASGVAT